MRDPDAGERVYEYDLANNLLRVNTPQGGTRRFVFDEVERMTAEYRSEPGTGEEHLVAEYHYDKAAGALPVPLLNRAGNEFGLGGRLAWVRDEDGEAHYVYDMRGYPVFRVRGLRKANENVLNWFSSSQEFDPTGHLINGYMGMKWP